MDARCFGLPANRLRRDNTVTTTMRKNNPSSAPSVANRTVVLRTATSDDPDAGPDTASSMSHVAEANIDPV
jgi:hypothetical protein